MTSFLRDTFQPLASGVHTLFQKAAEIKKTEGKFLLGAVVFPASLIVRHAVQEIFRECGGKRVWTPKLNWRAPSLIAKSPFNSIDLLKRRVGMSIAPILYGEFLQSYLLDKKLTLFLKRFAPKYANFPQSLTGKVSRIFLSVLLAGSLSYLCNLISYEHKLKWYNDCRYARSDCSWIKPVFNATGESIDMMINILFISTLQEVTGSSLAGMGFQLLRICNSDADTP